MKKQEMTAHALAAVLNANVIATGRIHASSKKKTHYIELKVPNDVDKALKIAEERGFMNVKKTGDNGRISIPNHDFKSQLKKTAKKTVKPVTKKNVFKKATKKPAPKKSVPAKKKRMPSDKIPVQAEILIGLITGIQAPNVRYRVVESIIREMSEVSMKSMLRKLGYCNSLKKAGSVDLSKISRRALEKELAKRWK